MAEVGYKTVQIERAVAGPGSFTLWFMPISGMPSKLLVRADDLSRWYSQLRRVFGLRPSEPLLVDGQHVTLEVRVHDSKVLALWSVDLSESAVVPRQRPRPTTTLSLVDEALRFINSKRVGVQSPLSAGAWSDDDIVIEAMRLGWEFSA